MKLTEMIKGRHSKDVVRPDTQVWYSLNEEHVLGPARNVTVSRLRMHLLIEHGVSVRNLKTPSDYGKVHLLAHAVLAHPELRECLGLSRDWGKG